MNNEMAAQKYWEKLAADIPALEALVLDQITFSKDALFFALKHLQPESFTDKNIVIFAAIKDLAEKGEAVDLMTVRLALPKELRDYFVSLFENSDGFLCSRIEYKAHIKLLYSAHKRREIQRLCKAGSVAEENLDEIISELQKSYLNREIVTEITGVELIGQMIDNIEDYSNAEKKAGIYSGLIALDDIIGGYPRGELTVLAAASGQGKTTFALFSALYISKNRPVIYYAYETTEKAMLEKSAGMLAGIEMHKIIHRQVDRARTADMVTALAGMVTPPNLQIVGTRGMGGNLSGLVMDIRARHRRGKADIIFLDYLQLVSANGNTRNEEISTILRTLKNLSAELDAAIVILSQLTKEGSRGEPELWHLRDSGAIAQDASIVIFIFSGDDPNANRTMAVRKNRYGNLSRFELLFDGKTYQNSIAKEVYGGR